MTVDLAMIGVGVDTTDIASGDAALDQLAATGERTESRINKSSTKMSGSLKKVKGDAKGAATEVTALGTSATKTGAKVAASASNLASYSKSAGAAKMHTANLTSQFNDIGVMLAAGQSPLQLAMQQGTQINQVFQQMGGGVGALKALGPALMSMVNPMSLMVIGTIAGVAALSNWAFAADEAEESGAELLKILEGMDKNLATSNRNLRADLRLVDPEELVLLDAIETKIKEISAFKDRIDKSIEGGLHEGTARGLAGSAIDSLSEELENYQAQLAEINRIRDTRESLIDGARELSDQERLLGEQMQKNTVETVKAAIAARSMVDTIVRESALRSAISAHGQNSLQVEGMRLEASKASLSAKMDELGVTSEVKAELLAAAQAAWDVEAGASGAAGTLSAAANEASRMASEIQRAVNGMINLGAQGATSLRQSQIRLENKGNPVATAGALAAEKFGDVSGFDPILRQGLQDQKEAFVANAQATETNRQALISWQKAQAKAAGGGGGGKGGKGKNPMTEYLRDAAALFQSTRTPAEQYAAELAKINQLHKMGLIDADTYGRALEDLEEKFDKTRETAKTLETGLEGMFVDMLADIGNADDAVAGFIKTLGRMALQAAFSGVFSGAFGGISNIFTSANGNAFAGGSPVAFASGGVVSRPTTFPMKDGRTGLMGEAGDEGILPLKRGKDGKLGVSAEMPQAVRPMNVQQGDTNVVTFAPQIDATGADPEAIDRLEKAVLKMHLEFEDRTVAAIQKGKKRRLL